MTLSFDALKTEITQRLGSKLPTVPAFVGYEAKFLSSKYKVNSLVRYYTTDSVVMDSG